MTDERPLIAHVYEIHGMVTSGELTKELAAKELSRRSGAGITERGAEIILAQDPSYIEKQYREAFELSEEGFARDSAEIAAESWRTNGTDSLGL